jgi:hypothetical protein
MSELLEGAGFVAEYFEDISDAHLSGTSVSGTPEVKAQAQLSLSVYVDDLAQKAENATRSLHEGHVRFVRGVFRAT